MPIVPTYKEQQVSSSPLPNNGFSIQPSPEHFGAGLGQAAEQYAGVFAEMKQRADVALSQDGLLQLQEYSDDLMNNPKTGLYTKLGRNAMGQSDETLNNINIRANEIYATLPEGKAREDFLKQSNVLGRQYHNQAKMFELREIQSFESSTNKGMQESNLKKAHESYGNPQAFNSYVALLEHNYVEYSRSRGVSDEEIVANVENLRNEAAWGAVQNYMASAPVQALSAIGEPSDVGGVSKVGPLNKFGGSPESTKGMLQAGNIDIYNRPKVKNKDGSISTVRTISIGTDQGEVLIPTVSDDGRLLSDDEAIVLFEETGNHLGVFDNPDDATAYAESLHNQQEKFYTNKTQDNRGGRNNNPGNLRISDNVWEGQTGDDGEFVQFASPEHGVRALGKNLITYRNKGFVTVNQIINRWAPKKDGNKTEKYIAFVSQRMGVDPNIPIDVTNIDTLKSITSAIMAQEGKHSVTDDQVNTGLQAALGLTRLPDVDKSLYQPEIRKAQGGGFPWWPMLTPVQQYQLIKQGNAAQKEQQRELADEMTLTHKNIYAATDEGLQPTNVPSEAAYVRAYGEYKGLKAYAEVQEQLKYGSIIAAAKEVSPDSRSDILEQNRPKDPNAPNFAAQQQRYEKMRIKFNEFDKVWEANQGAQMVSNAVNYGVPLDPNSKSNKAATDSYYASNFGNLNLSNEEQVTGVLQLVGSTGIIPSQLLSHLNAAAVTQDAKTVLPAADFVSRLYESNPAAITGMSKEKQAFYLNIKQYKDAGASDDEAIKISFNQTYNQTDAVKIQLEDERRTSGYKKEVLKAAEGFVGDRKEFFRIDPSATDETPEAKAFLRDYKLLYDANFDRSGGNADTAKKLTNQQISNSWSITEINGKAELMKYAPESLYPGGPSGWQAKQWEDEKWKLKYGEEKKGIDIELSQLGRTTHITEKKPKPIVDGDIILVADHHTVRSKDYAIMIVTKNKEGLPDAQFYYDKSGNKMRYMPELESYKPYQDMLAEAADNEVKQEAKGKARRRYEIAHDKRIERQKEQLSNYFSWGGNE
ncbi:hypothetical protein N0G65_000136 [Providencia rettgeri]|nr:hypothetical protein [Providencia rettgeri]